MFAEDSVNNNRAANECNRGAKRGVSKGNEIKKKKKRSARSGEILPNRVGFAIGKSGRHFDDSFITCCVFPLT